MATNSAMASPIPTGPRAPASPGLIASIGRAWDLGEIAGVIDLGGTYNLNLGLRTERGHVVLRVYRPWVRPERLAAVQSVREALRRDGLPVPPILPSRDGSLAVSRHHRLIEVEAWLADDGGADNLTRLRAAAGLLSRLHAGLRTAAPGSPFVPAPVSNALAPAVFDDWLARTGRVVASVPGSAAARTAIRAHADAASIWRRARTIQRPSLPRQLVHGDYGHENVRFRGDTPSAIIDFDFLDVRERIVDLAHLAFSPHWMAPFRQLGVAPSDRDWLAVSDLIHHYDATTDRPLTAAEVAALPVAMAMVPLTWIAASWLQEDVVAAVNLVAPELMVAGWLVENHHELARRWADGR